MSIKFIDYPCMKGHEFRRNREIKSNISCEGTLLRTELSANSLLQSLRAWLLHDLRGVSQLWSAPLD